MQPRAHASSSKPPSSGPQHVHERTSFRMHSPNTRTRMHACTPPLSHARSRALSCAHWPRLTRGLAGCSQGPGSPVRLTYGTTEVVTPRALTHNAARPAQAVHEDDADECNSAKISRLAGRLAGRCCIRTLPSFINTHHFGPGFNFISTNDRADDEHLSCCLSLAFSAPRSLV